LINDSQEIQEPGLMLNLWFSRIIELVNPLINDSQEIQEPVLMLNLWFSRIIELVSTFDWVIIIGKYLGKECKC
jgi:hypothetical protein